MQLTRLILSGEDLMGLGGPGGLLLESLMDH